MFKTDGSFFHPLAIGNTELPKAFTFPFNYSPHELSRLASEELQQYLMTQRTITHDFGVDSNNLDRALGKMFGVLIVQNSNNQVGYLAAFSGKIGDTNQLSGFVPPVFDTLNPKGFYKKGEEELDKMNAEVEQFITSNQICDIQNELDKLTVDEQEELSQKKAMIKQCKAKRDRIRKKLEHDFNLSEAQKNERLEGLRRESINQNYELKEIKRSYKRKRGVLQQELDDAKVPLLALKRKRKMFSAELQRHLHQNYNFLNGRGESKNLMHIFSEQAPAAAGECAAPKLLQYAYANNLKPLAMAEFWWGKSPNSQVRKHKHYYPSCRSKCEPILGHMLEGLEVEPNPITISTKSSLDLEILFEDERLIVVNKPVGLLSVPGKYISDSVLSRIKDMYPNASGPLLVHRLDRATSGILIIAKDLQTYISLQEQFTNKTVQKTYVAILDGVISETHGTIDLPLRVDLDNRPQQLVCYEHGKHAITHFKVLSNTDKTTRIHFFPVTGRTHQLRVHASHQQGLNTAIIGDDLYGVSKDRLYLHAEHISFLHPLTKKVVSFKAECPF